jgi:hypothetical protein
VHLFCHINRLGYLKIGLNWENVWSDGGRFMDHSTEKDLEEGDKLYRSDDKNSQIRKINIRTAITEIWLPIEEMIFHDKYASG